MGARLANTASRFIDQIHTELLRADKATRFFSYAYAEKKVSIICEFSAARYKKDKREFDKQVERALDLLERNEPGKLNKFVKKSGEKDKLFIFDTALKANAEKLPGIKNYVTNISEQELSSAKIVVFYRDLWYVEQAFRMCKSDLRARPIFHHSQEAIWAQVLICFMALMIGKYLEIKTGQSLRQIQDELWRVQEATIRDVHILRIDTSELTANSSSS